MNIVKLAPGVCPTGGLKYPTSLVNLVVPSVRVCLQDDELPAITEAQAREFAKEAYQLIPAAERPKSLALGLSAPAESANLPEQRGTPEAVAAALGFITNADLDYDSWVRIGMAIKGALAEAGWPLFEAWSATSVKNEAKTTAKSWSSFAPQRIGAGTIYKLALDQGWVPEQDLQLNGEVVMNGHHPAKELLQALQIQNPITLNGTNIAPVHPQPKALPTGWDDVGGVLGELMHLMVTTAKRPQPVLALGASLCAIGALMGRKYRTESNIRSNLYVIGIAESGAGKNHSRVVINDLFRRAGLLQYVGGNKIVSGK